MGTTTRENSLLRFDRRTSLPAQGESVAAVSYVAPAREISILVGVAMGARLLCEDRSASRLIAAGAMVAGVMALALG